MAISISLDPAAEQRLHDHAHLTGRSKSDCLRELILSGLDDLEDFYLADATMERVRMGKVAVLGATEVRSALGLGREVDLLNTGASMPQIMVKGGWAKTDTVMSYVERVRPTF